MNVVERDPMSEVLDRVNTWSPAQGITLARRILESLEARLISEPPHQIAQRSGGTAQDRCPASDR